LGIFYCFQEKYDEAEIFMQRAFAIYQVTLGDKHPHTLNSLVTIKSLEVMKLLQCNNKTLITILLELAQLAKISEFNNITGEFPAPWGA
jgi:hypothetical protein